MYVQTHSTLLHALLSETICRINKYLSYLFCSLNALVPAANIILKNTDTDFQRNIELTRGSSSNFIVSIPVTTSWNSATISILRTHTHTFTANCAGKLRLRPVSLNIAPIANTLEQLRGTWSISRAIKFIRIWVLHALKALIFAKYRPSQRSQVFYYCKCTIYIAAMRPALHCIYIYIFIYA